MISIICEREILDAVTDENITSTASEPRVDSFNEATFLNTLSKDVEVVIEGILYKKIEPRLKDDHKKVFNDLYDIDYSAVGVSGYNITKAIKFIVKNNKLPISKRRKVIIITENKNHYDDMDIGTRLQVLTPEEFLIKLEKFKIIMNDLVDIYSALVTAFFLSSEVCNGSITN